MELKEQLQNDLKEAMKSKDTFKRDTIRFLMSAIKQVEVDTRKELSDEDIIKIIQKSVKQREEAASQYKEGGREDLYEKEMKEADILKSYLPKQLSDEELETELKKIIEEVGASSMKDMGKIMGVATKKLAGRADGKRINQMVKKILG
ncbi:GatB/YqeY domain-containing protein [Nitratiruptor sp. SB155-2]|uniref:GatB/YqeY domain-containing protein n=1 Tax=Nitratiruptor sp. (strain SB155-2) TaxID=387092 RepID=UPI0001587263|nr:GatB/YqeY domain-containing protein [Nitratiruptor sp. SB155-2]BAF70098.1 GatB/Yqey domain protein [Nitratiruptor sp. SB155-2]